MNKKDIQLVENLCVKLDVVSVYDLHCYSTEELIYQLIKKINEVINGVNDLSQEHKQIVEYIQYLYDEGLGIEVLKVMEKWLADGTIADLINEQVLGSINEKLTKLLPSAKIELIADLDGTSYKKGDLVDTSWIRTEQIKNYSYLMRKLHKGEPVNILTRGDSLTYGYDENSTDRREPLHIPTDTGKTHIRYRASKTYPEALEGYLNNLGCNVNVTNIGYSGAWVKFSYDEYYKKRSDMLEIIMLGTNDSRLDNCPYKGDIKKFNEYYEQLIIREIIWGNGLILMMPLTTKYMKDLDVETFRTTVKMLGDKYSIPVIDASELIMNHKASVWSDNTHLNGEGYKILGSKISSCIGISDYLTPRTIKDGDILSVRPTVDSIIYHDLSNFGLTETGYTPDSIGTGRRYCGRLYTGGRISYTFYASEDNLVLVPTIFIPAGGQVKFILDNGLQQPLSPLTTNDYKYATWDGSTPHTWTLINDKGTNYTYSKVTARNNFADNPPLKINNKGWYTLTILCSEASADYTCNLFGIEVMNNENYYNIVNRQRYKTLYKSVTGDSEIGTVIQLNESMDNFDYLIFTTNYAGYTQQIMDFKQANELDIRTSNLVNNDTSASVTINEFAFQKINDNSVKIVRNKTVNISGTPLTAIIKNEEGYKASIKTIIGVKL